MTDREALKLALEALECHVLGFDQVRKMELAIEALEQALEQPERHVSYVCPQCYWTLEQPSQDLIVGYADVHDLTRDGHDFWVSRQPGKNTVPLYLYGHPPNIWQGLTDAEVDAIAIQLDNTTIGWSTHEFARAIEDEIRAKNGY